MSNLVTFRRELSIKERFAQANASVPDNPKKVEIEEIEAAPVASAGNILYNLYRIERKKQNWDELSWESLVTAQRRVWNNMATILGME